MDNSTSRLKWLFNKFQNNDCTPEELNELLQLIAEEKNNKELYGLLGAAVEAGVNDLELDSGKADQLFARIIKKEKEQEAAPTLVRSMFSWQKIAAAASIIFIVGAGIYLSLKPQKQPIITSRQPSRKAVTEILPGRNNALLTLADGSAIVLDSAANGTLAEQGRVEVIKTDGQITYTDTKSAVANTYNTLSTARGNQYQLVLADGTKVWLNAASSIYFPVAFTGRERRVSITGEAYFEVAHNAAAPFKVVVNKMEITVLGTHFNVNAYSDEASIKTTLLEGAVKITAGKDSKVLRPLQQANLDESGAFKVASNVDTEEIMAWKNGYFIFNGESIESIMRQISRWYDVEIVYRRKLDKETFSGIVSRQSKLPQVLRILEAGGVQFQIEGKQIIIQ